MSLPAIRRKKKVFVFCLVFPDISALEMTYQVTKAAASANIGIFRERLRMEEEGRKLLEEGIRKKLISPGRGELSTFPNGTKVKTKPKKYYTVEGGVAFYSEYRH